MNPLGKTLEHFFLVEVDSVPFPYGAPVDTGMGTTVAVLTMTTGVLDETAPSTPPMEETPAEFADAVSVTVTVDKAVVTVTVTGTQLPDPEAPAAPTAPAAPEEAGTTVIYFVEVLVPVIVVVGPVSLAETSPSTPVTPAAPDSPGRVAYTVAVEVCLMVVVTTVVEDPEPSVYVRTTDSDPDPVCSAPDDPLLAVGAAVIPVPRGTVDAGVEMAPPAFELAVAE